ncbi:hypothetical protein [Streptomyces amritsarensis]|uniref:hypothetical protein n=1 Tax=Streptomyces amritsarensis TaxID=681158 RepID=UPI0036C0A256
MLRQSFERRDTAGGALMEQSRAEMRNMHELNHRLAARGVGPRFTLPAWLLPGSPTGDLQAADGRYVREAAAAAARARETIAALGDASLREMAIRHQRDTDALLAALARLDGGAPQRTPAPSGLPGGGG